MQKYIHACLCAMTLTSSDVCLAVTHPTRNFPVGTHEVFMSDTPNIDTSQLEKITAIVQSSIANGFYPGAVILAGQNDQIIYRGVFGSQQIMPTVEPMRFDTIFDVASLTKVIVTATAVMQLVEQKKLDLDTPVAHYWPAFAAHEKENITVRELLIHTSGLPAGIDSPELNAILPAQNRAPLTVSWNGKDVALEKIIAMKPVTPRGKQFIYSDVNFITLGHLVEIASGQPLNVYAEQHIFKPLGMQHSSFTPTQRDDIAPTQIMSGALRWGEVHDPTAYLMGGVAGMAGLFSNAHDIALFAQTILNNGRIAVHTPARQEYLLQPATITNMISPQTPKDILATRGFGWDINSPFAVRGTVFSGVSFGHTGWTGTSLWIDPVSQTRSEERRVGKECRSRWSPYH